MLAAQGVAHLVQQFVGRWAGEGFCEKGFDMVGLLCYTINQSTKPGGGVDGSASLRMIRVCSLWMDLLGNRSVKVRCGMRNPQKAPIGKESRIPYTR